MKYGYKVVKVEDDKWVSIAVPEWTGLRVEYRLGERTETFGNTPVLIYSDIDCAVKMARNSSEERFVLFGQCSDDSKEIRWLRSLYDRGENNKDITPKKLLNFWNEKAWNGSISPWNHYFKRYMFNAPIATFAAYEFVPTDVVGRFHNGEFTWL